MGSQSEKVDLFDLFHIPQATVLGEYILDSYIPFKDYKSDVEDLDFVFLISGDSMKPDLTNGSIVLFLL